MPTPPSDIGTEETGRLLGRMLGVITLTAVMGSIVAGTMIWLLLTDPVAMASAVETGEISPLARRIAAALWSALMGLLGLF